jgi:hypothetical protein
LNGLDGHLLLGLGSPFALALRDLPLSFENSS